MGSDDCRGISRFAQEMFLTIQNRPYVVAFLLTFLVLSTLHIGIFRTIAWLVWGYGIAFVSEFSSIHNGFPYGLYHYIPQAFAGELVLAGVPVWDSISYVFVAYAAYALAWFWVEPHFLKFSVDPHVSPSRPLKTALIGAVLMVLADMVIDPVANLGEKWFLGKVYYYETPGIYFGVPVSNFIGWLLVAGIIIAGFQLLEKFIFKPMGLPTWGAKRFPFQALLGPAFYFGIVGFSLVITFWIGAYRLSAASSLLTLFVMLGSVKR